MFAVYNKMCYNAAKNVEVYKEVLDGTSRLALTFEQLSKWYWLLNKMVQVGPKLCNLAIVKTGNVMSKAKCIEESSKVWKISWGWHTTRVYPITKNESMQFNYPKYVVLYFMFIEINCLK